MKFNNKQMHINVYNGIKSVKLSDYKHCHWRTTLMVERCVDQMSFFNGPMRIVIRLRTVLGGAIQLSDIDTVDDLQGNEASFIEHMNSAGIPLQEVDYNDASRFFKESVQLAMEAGYNLPDGYAFELVNLMFSHPYPMVAREIPSAEIYPTIMDLFTVISNDKNLITGLVYELRDLDHLEMVGPVNQKTFAKAMDVILKKKKFVLLSLEFSFYWLVNAKQTKIAAWIHNEIVGLKDLLDESFRESIAVALIINCICQKARDNMMPVEELHLGTGLVKNFTGQACLPKLIDFKTDVKQAKKVCAFCDTPLSKKWLKCSKCNREIYCNFEHWKNDWKNHSKDCMIDAPRLQIMAAVRGASSKSVDEICQGLEVALSSKDYPLAIRILTKAIDKVTINPISRTQMTDQLLSLCTKRAYCNLQMALLTKSTQSANLVIEDYIDFYEATRGGNLDDSLTEVQLFESYREKAEAFIDSQKMLDFLPENVRNSVAARNSPKTRKRVPKIKPQESGGRYELVDCNLMAMHGSLNLDCSICRVPYTELPDPSFAINLVCNHSTCASCLAGLHNVCAQGELGIQFSCPLCRDPINMDKFRYLINSVASRVKSFVFFSNLLPIPGLHNLIGSLLLKYEFDIIRVDCALFNIASLQPLESVSRDFSYTTKQEIYDQARKPILALEQEFREIQDRLDFIYDHNSVEWKETMKELYEKIKQLDKARMNASSDIFERMNSSGNLGMLIDADQESDSSAMGHFKVDFHGLHPSEAINKINEIILPVLYVMEYIEIVTGKGKHSINGSSILFKSVTDYLKKIPGLEIKIPKGNSGMINVRYAH